MINTSELNARVNINDLSSDEKKQLIRDTYQRCSAFQQLFGCDYIEIDCKEFYQAFRSEIERVLQQKKIITNPVILEELHNYIDDKMRTYNFNDGVNQLSTFFYEMDEKFSDVYLSFIKKYLYEEVFKFPFWFQNTPTIRIHCPNGINSDHYPRYHTDIGYGHPPEEFNLWMPLTQKRDGHGFRIMNVEHSRQILEMFDYDFTPFIDRAINDKSCTKECHQLSTPVETQAGKILIFDSRCIHTGEPLRQHTRASIDIRILPLSDWNKMNIEYQGSGRRKIIFAPGHCYNNLSSNQLK
jgi:hypothetical protein